MMMMMMMMRRPTKFQLIPLHELRCEMPSSSASATLMIWASSSSSSPLYRSQRQHHPDRRSRLNRHNAMRDNAA